MTATKAFQRNVMKNYVPVTSCAPGAKNRGPGRGGSYPDAQSTCVCVCVCVCVCALASDLAACFPSPGRVSQCRAVRHEGNQRAKAHIYI